MLTEDEVRRLLHGAAQDVEVGSPPPIASTARDGDRAPRHPWFAPTVVAAAAAMVVAGVVAATLTDPSAPAAPDGLGRVPISLGSWEVGQRGGEAVEGQLLQRDDCVYLQTADGPVDVLWPRDHTAVRVPGTVALRDGDGDELARLGDWLRLEVSDEDPDGLVCSVGGDVVGVHSPVVVERVPIGWPGLDDFDLAERFARFAARTQRGLVSFGPSVGVGVGSTIIDRPPYLRLLRARAWRVPVDLPGVSPQLSPLSYLAEMDGRYRLSSVQRPCDGQRPVAVPRALDGYDVLSFEPVGDPPCADWYAVDVYVDEGRIVGVMLRLGEAA